jgi:hypothetical protein
MKLRDRPPLLQDWQQPQQTGLFGLPAGRILTVGDFSQVWKTAPSVRRPPGPPVNSWPPCRVNRIESKLVTSRAAGSGGVGDDQQTLVWWRASSRRQEERLEKLRALLKQLPTMRCLRGLSCSMTYPRHRQESSTGNDLNRWLKAKDMIFMAGDTTAIIGWIQQNCLRDAPSHQLSHDTPLLEQKIVDSSR